MNVTRKEPKLLSYVIFFFKKNNKISFKTCCSFLYFQHHDTHRWDRLDENAPPHVFNVSASAYRRMRETETDQVIIVSGESGAGKTESTKYMVHHMVHMCQGGEMELHNKIVKVVQ